MSLLNELDAIYWTTVSAATWRPASMRRPSGLPVAAAPAWPVERTRRTMPAESRGVLDLIRYPLGISGIGPELGGKRLELLTWRCAHDVVGKKPIVNLI